MTTSAKNVWDYDNQFAAGQKVKNQYGRTLTVLKQVGCMVYVREEMGHYHPSKLYAI